MRIIFNQPLSEEKIILKHYRQVIDTLGKQTVYSPSSSSTSGYSIPTAPKGVKISSPFSSAANSSNKRYSSSGSLFENYYAKNFGLGTTKNGVGATQVVDPKNTLIGKFQDFKDNFTADWSNFATQKDKVTNYVQGVKDSWTGNNATNSVTTPSSNKNNISPTISNTKSQINNMVSNIPSNLNTSSVSALNTISSSTGAKFIPTSASAAMNGISANPITPLSTTSTSTGTGAKFVPTSVSAAMNGISANPITPLPTTSTSTGTGAKFIPTSASDAMKGISATPIISLDNKQKYGDFAYNPGAYGLLNTGSNQNLGNSKLDARTISQMDAMVANNPNAINEMPSTVRDLYYSSKGNGSISTPLNVTANTSAMPTTTDNNQKMLDEFGITLPNWNTGNTTDPNQVIADAQNQGQSLIDQQTKAAEQKINDAYAKAGIPNPNQSSTSGVQLPQVNTDANTSTASNNNDVALESLPKSNETSDNVINSDFIASDTSSTSATSVSDSSNPDTKKLNGLSFSDVKSYPGSPAPTFTSTSSSSAGSIMSLNNDNIGEIISKINASVSELEANVGTIESNLISKINNSWIADEASTYTSKVTDSINKTKSIIETLKLLSQTYTKALNESTNTQQDVSSTVSNI